MHNWLRLRIGVGLVDQGRGDNRVARHNFSVGLGLEEVFVFGSKSENRVRVRVRVRGGVMSQPQSLG